MIKNLNVGTKFLVGFSIITIILVVSGIISIYLTQQIGSSGLEVGERLSPLGDVVTEVELTATKAHLLFEEVMNGDTTKDIKAAWALLDQSAWYVKAILEGGKDKNTVYYPIQSPRIRKKVIDLQKLLADFTKTAHEWYDQHSSAAVGSTADQEFDTLYQSIQNRLKSTAETLKNSATKKLNDVPAYMEALGRVGEAKYLLADGHLFLEEVLTGDTSAKIESVYESFNRAGSLIRGAAAKLGSNTLTLLTKELEQLIQKANQRHDTYTKDKALQESKSTVFNTAFDNFSQLADEAENDLIKEIDAGLTKIKTMEKNATTVTMIFCLIAIFLAVLLGLSISRSITRPLKQCATFADQIAGGNLNTELVIDQKDEIGKLTLSLNTMADKIRDMIINIKERAAKLNKSTEDIVSGGSELALRTSEQAASLTETSTTIEEFSTILKSSTDNSEEAHATIEEFNNEIQTKKELIVNVTTTMTEINDSSRKIDNIVNVINDISFQTNLLALNAAVEAARAGDAGRGFAVVAAEVRNLAQKTAESSKTIQEIVSQNVESTQKGMALIKQTSEFFETILQTLQHMAEQIQLIATGAREQSTGVEQINNAVEQLEGVVNQNAALVEKFEATGKSLKIGADELYQLVDQFKTDHADSTAATTLAKTSSPYSTRTVENKTPAAVGDDDDFFDSDEGGFQEF